MMRGVGSQQQAAAADEQPPPPPVFILMQVVCYDQRLPTQFFSGS
jgi:hypothetical protein